MPRCCCFWLEKKDSNPHKQSQSLSCYPYTILQYHLRREAFSRVLYYYSEGMRVCQHPVSKKFAFGFFSKSIDKEPAVGLLLNYKLQNALPLGGCAQKGDMQR